MHPPHVFVPELFFRHFKVPAYIFDVSIADVNVTFHLAALAAGFAFEILIELSSFNFLHKQQILLNDIIHNITGRI